MEELERKGYLAGIAAAMAAVGYDGVEEEDAEKRLVGLAAHVMGRIEASVEEARLEEGLLREAVERKVLAMEKGVPVEHAERFVRLAGTYMREGVGFEDALAEAMADFPAAGQAGMGVRVAGRAVGNAPERTWTEMGLAERVGVYRRDPERARRLAEESGKGL